VGKRLRHKGLPASPTSLPTFSRWPAIDVFRTLDSKIMVRADVPGLAPSNIVVEAGGSTVVISGSRPIDPLNSSETARVRTERMDGSFYRRIRLPVDVSSDSKVVDLKRGVLSIELTIAV